MLNVNFDSKVNRSLSEVSRLRKFAGTPAEFWPAFVSAAADLIGADKGILILKDQKDDNWKKLSEWSNNGVPDHAAKCHRLDPEFLKLADHYMRAVTEAALPYLATRGGRVILWQADNEIDPWPHLYTEQLGLGTTAGPFQEFLRERYGTLAALNAAWETQYTDWSEPRSPTPRTSTSPSTPPSRMPPTTLCCR